MYAEKIEPILNDIEDKKVEIAGGGVVGIVLCTTLSLIKYIANLTLGKKGYENVYDEVDKIIKKADDLIVFSKNSIDKDKEILEEILSAYKKRKENEESYQNACIKGTEFCMEVLKVAKETYDLAMRISYVGNKMLVSDFEICKYYAIASIKSANQNVNINVDSVKDEEFRRNIKNKCGLIMKGV